MPLPTNVALSTNPSRIPPTASQNAQSSLQSKPSDQPKSNTDKQLRICGLSVLGTLALMGAAYMVIQRQLQTGQCDVALNLASRVSDNPIGSLFFQENLCNSVKDWLPKCAGLEPKIAAAHLLDTHCQSYIYRKNVLDIIEKYGEENIPLAHDTLKTLPAGTSRENAALQLSRRALDAGDLKRAKEIVDTMLPESQRQQKYELFLHPGYIKHLCKAKDLAAVQDLIELEASPELKKAMRRGHSSLYHALSNTKDFDFVLKVVRELAAKSPFFSSGSRDLDFGIFVRDVLKSASPNRFEIAEQIADTILSQTTKIYVYNSIHQALINNKLNTEANALKQKITVLEQTKDLDPNALIGNVVRLCANKSFKEAEEDAKLIANPIIQLKAYAVLYEAYQAEGGWGIYANPHQSRIDELKKVDFSEAFKILADEELGLWVNNDIKTLQEFATKLGQKDIADDFSELFKQRGAKIAQLQGESLNNYITKMLRRVGVS